MGKTQQTLITITTTIQRTVGLKNAGKVVRIFRQINRGLGGKNELESQHIEEEADLEPLALVKDTSKNSQSGGKMTLKKNISQFLQ